MRVPATVVVVAASYPYEVAKERTFLERETELLAERFEHVVLAPENAGGELLPLPGEVEIDDSLARALADTSRAKIIARACTSSLPAWEAVLHPSAFRSVATAKRLLEFASRAQIARAWALRFLRRRPRTILYTYWWGAITTGFGLAKRRVPTAVVVSRAHGFDLYEERHHPAYLPARQASLGVLDALFPASERGRAYLVERYAPAMPCETSLLGVRDPGGVARASTDGVLRVVSCSFLAPVKRIDLLIDGLAAAGTLRPSQRIEWTHLGVGRLEASLKEHAAKVLPKNVHADFPGYTSQEGLFEFYLSRPADVFVNVSASEGTPVSIMEAIAAGIPILATAVGGNTEIAGHENGVLLRANPDAREIAEALFRFMEPSAAPLREGSRRLWATQYNAEANFARFVDRLAELARTRA